MGTGVSLKDRVAAEVRAEMARQRRTGIELAACLEISQQSASRRASGEQGFDLDEVAKVADWLDVPLEQLLGLPARASA